jgi:aldehyde:ferredoxin oxidoreductase
MFNLREGFGKKDDTLPTRILEEPIAAGPSKGNTVPLDKLLPMYYETRKWDANGNVPDSAKKELGL